MDNAQSRTAPKCATQRSIVSAGVVRQKLRISACQSRPGLFTVHGRNDRYLGDFGFNRRHPLAVPAGCILVLLSPFIVLILVLWTVYASIQRFRGRRSACRHNAEVFGRA